MKGQISGIKGTGSAGFVKGSLVPNMQALRSIFAIGAHERSALGRRWKSAPGAISGAVGMGKAYMGFAGAGTRGMVERGWRGAGMAAAEVPGAWAARKMGPAMGLGAAMIGASMATGVSVFDQAQGIGGGALAYRGLSKWAQGGGLGRQVAMGLGMAGAAGGAGWLSTGELALGGIGYGAVRGAQSLIGAAAVAKAPWLSRIGGGRGRAIGAAAGVGLGLLI